MSLNHIEHVGGGSPCCAGRKWELTNEGTYEIIFLQDGEQRKPYRGAEQIRASDIVREGLVQARSLDSERQDGNGYTMDTYAAGSRTLHGAQLLSLGDTAGHLGPTGFVPLSSVGAHADSAAQNNRGCRIPGVPKGQVPAAVNGPCPVLTTEQPLRGDSFVKVPLWYNPRILNELRPILGARSESSRDQGLEGKNFV